MQQSRYHEIVCRSAMNRLGPGHRLPYEWDLNIYKGCAHGCAYCFAQYTAGYMGAEDFFRDVYVKTNVAEQLERELRKPSWKREVVNIGGVTDSYQPAEEKYRLMPDIWRILLKYRTPVILSTKSDLILRDFDAIASLSRVTSVNIASTVTAMDESVRLALEPGGVSSRRRLAMLKAFRGTGAVTGLHAMPLVPYLTDTDENLTALCEGAREAEVDYLLPSTLSLRGRTRQCFFSFLSRCYPALYGRVYALYQPGADRAAYKNDLYRRLNALRVRYGLTTGYLAPMRARLAEVERGRQISFFDEEK